MSLCIGIRAYMFLLCETVQDVRSTSSAPMRVPQVALLRAVAEVPL